MKGSTVGECHGADSDGIFIGRPKCRFRALIGNETGLGSGGVYLNECETARHFLYGEEHARAAAPVFLDTELR